MSETKPFSGPKYIENSARCSGDDLPCVICGRPIKPGMSTGILRVVDGGARFATVTEDVDPCGDMGCWPIGSHCLKKHPDLKELLC